MEPIKLFLDDVRTPDQCIFYMRLRVGEFCKLYRENWVIVRSYDDFVAALQTYKGNISHISFDHDLAESHYDAAMYDSAEAYLAKIADSPEKTGYDCAVYFNEYYKKLKLPFPAILVHSMNPVGMQRIYDIWKP